MKLSPDTMIQEESAEGEEYGRKSEQETQNSILKWKRAKGHS